MELFLFIALTHFIALLSPGPDFFLILMHLMKYGSNLTRYIVFGIACGNAVILLVIFSSLWWLGKIHPMSLYVLQYLGVAYLLYLAWLCFQQQDELHLDETPRDLEQLKTSRMTCFLQGLQSSVLNPKNLMFYNSLVILVYDRFNANVFVLLSLWLVSVVLIWNLFLLHMLNWRGCLNYLKKKSVGLYRVSGCCFAGFALMLLIFMA